MNDPNWIASLSTTEQPEFPGSLAKALRIRRRQRRTVAAAIGGMVAAVIAVAVLWIAQPQAPAPLTPVMVDSHKPAPQPEPTANSPSDSSPLTIASLYGAPGNLPLEFSGETEASLRIGDHWDPDRVRAWVLD